MTSSISRRGLLGGAAAGGIGIALSGSYEAVAGTRPSVGYGELSNDGQRVVGIYAPDDVSTYLCVTPVDGGLCIAISELFSGAWGWNYRWSPDDSAILTTRTDGAELVLDADGGDQTQPEWMSQGAESWQRQAP